MKTIMIIFVLTLLAGCAITPVVPYDTYRGQYYTYPYYAPQPVYGYYGYDYNRSWYKGNYGPRYSGYYRGRGHGCRGGYGRRR